MKFGILDPEKLTFELVEAANGHAAYKLARLHPMKTDHGTLMRLPNAGLINYVCYEFAFFVPVTKQHYCAIGDRLIAGRAVIYQTNRHGYTIDLDGWRITPTWFGSADQVETAIAAGVVNRPMLSVNGELLWQWPQRPPPDLAERMEHD